MKFLLKLIIFLVNQIFSSLNRFSSNHLSTFNSYLIEKSNPKA